LLGAVRLRQSRPEAAAEVFEQGLATAPDAPDLLVGKVQAMVAQQQRDAAIAFLNTHLTDDAESPLAYNLLGEVYAEGGEPKLADEAFRLAIETRKDWTVPYLNLGRLRIDSDDAAGAIDAYAEGLKSMPGNRQLLFGLATARTAAGDIAGALEAYGRVLEADQSADVAANNFAALVADYRTDDPELLKRALALTSRFEISENPFYLDTLGWVHARLGNVNEAIIYLKRATAMAPEEAQFRYHLGMVYRDSGMTDQAVEQLERALNPDTAYPGIEEARAALETLKSL
jgi:tetratricopeptide (TPR) repeat protein